MQIAPPAPGESFGFSFLSSEMHFDSKVVKGVPYSAEAVTESVQSLADGNRVTRKSTAMLYRDSEGRTRREQTLNHVGPGRAPMIRSRPSSSTTRWRALITCSTRATAPRRR
jgi:hypothetical protein